ncbi:MAG: PilZ domain-containing protein [Cyanobacteria bacterium P01_H01_bin.74]
MNKKETERTEAINKRLHFRLPIKLTVTIQADSVFKAESQDLSASGMRLIANTNVSPGEVVSVQFVPDQTFGEVKTQAEVIRCWSAFPLDMLEKEVFTINFIDLDKKVQDKLVSFCFKKEIEIRRHLKN